MKKVINGKLYNIFTAKRLAYWETCENAGDFNYYEEALYRKRSGEYFLYSCGYRGGDENFTPLSLEEALEWAEKYMTGDEYISAFGEVPEDDGYQTISLMLPMHVVDAAQKAADDAGITLSAYLQRLIVTGQKAAHVSP